ncbi:MAG TPA: ParB/RepB/Spo0J family partition protein [Alphaproteobacteria bacterium]|nr:ParB/RepB/Spo0J family partition protein [Alphaproteobacteria bacterium]
MTTPEPKRRGLGRGLSALLGSESEDLATLEKLRTVRQLPTGVLRPGRFQPRHRFDPEEMAALVRSVQAQGILQPILVRRLPGDTTAYEIIAGERRWRAAQEAQLHEVPVIVRDLTDSEALEIALVENVQRQDLTPLEEAEAYRRLMEEFAHTQEDLARVVGKSRSHVANTLRLLSLPPPVKELLEQGKLSAGHARALLTAPDPAVLAQRIVAEGLNVREAEKLAQSAAGSAPRKARPPAPAKDANTRALEHDLSLMLGLRVTVNEKGSKGELILHYDSLNQLDDLVRRLMRE